MPLLRRNSPDIVVSFNGRVVPTARVESIEGAVGGTSTATIEFVDVPRDEAVAQGTKIVGFEQQECVIMRLAAGKVTCLHWGMVDARTLITNDSESQRVLSRIQPYHFGIPILGQLAYNPKTGKAGTNYEPIVFNPEWDGNIAVNRSNRIDDETKACFFIHPEQRRTKASMLANGAGSYNPWTLPLAVEYLCKVGNRAETYFKNPNFAELNAVLSSDENILRNHAQPYGEYLPAQLDAILTPYGYGWNVDVSDPGKKRIVIWKREGGQAIRSKLQRAGEILDLNKTTTEAIQITGDVASRLVNEVQVVGDNIQIEGTFELVPAWEPSYDSLDDDLLNLDQEADDTNGWLATPAHARVWRDWVLNEAGDYNGLRDTIRSAFDFRPLFESVIQTISRRRKFLPCITLDADGSPYGHHHGVYVEFYDSVEREWLPICKVDNHQHTIQILEKECGIRFAGPHVPTRLRELGLSNTKIRVTASVEMDARVFWSEKAGASINKNIVSHVINLRSRFKKRGISTTSIFAAKVRDGSLKSTVVDDTDRAKKLAQELLASWNQGQVNGTVTLPGVDWDIAQPLGKPFGGISGRDIDFSTDGGNKYPVVTAFRYDFTNQQITLSLDTWRQEVRT